VADKLAKLATKKKTIKMNRHKKGKQERGKHNNTRDRDWPTQPTTGTDPIYITQRIETPAGQTNVWIDGKIHAWARQDTQNNILAKRLKQKQE
jgi:hypothetical protein